MRTPALALALSALLLAAPFSSLAAQQGAARYGDIVLGDEEAFLDLEMDAGTAWLLLRRELGDAAGLLPEAVLTDTWLVVDDLWLRLEPLPYRSGSWVRVRVRVGDMLGSEPQQRAEGLLVGLALALDALRGAPPPPPPRPAPAPAAVGLAPAVVTQPLMYAWVPYGVLFSADWLANSWWVGSGGQVSLSVYVQQEPLYWWGWHLFDPFWHGYHDFWYFDHWYSHHHHHWNWYDGYGWGHPTGCVCCGGNGGGDDGTGGGNGGGGNGGGGDGGGSPMNPRIANYRKGLDVAPDLRTVDGGVVAYGGAGANRQGPRSVRVGRTSAVGDALRVARTSSVQLQPLPRGSTTRLGTIETSGFGNGATVLGGLPRGSSSWSDPGASSSSSRTAVTRAIGSPVPGTSGTSVAGRSSSRPSTPVVSSRPSPSSVTSSRTSIASRSTPSRVTSSRSSAPSRSTPRASSSSSSRSSSSARSSRGSSSSSRGRSSSAGRSSSGSSRSSGRSSGGSRSGGGRRGGRGG